MRPQAFVILLVGKALVVLRVESADAMEVVTAVFTKFIGKGETDVQPVVVAGGDVNMTRFNSLKNDFNIIGPVAGIGDRG